MPKRSRKRDLNVTAAEIVRDATSEEPDEQETPEKDPAAVSLGRRGGKKGGKARAAIVAGLVEGNSIRATARMTRAA
ncbi:MAG: hypothetical protein IH851_03745 [Armatimonadetes bacterium]|nr:hypothetical protein [Armatimonadota bacterium]